MPPATNPLLYQNKYRISSTRLPGYDYSQNGFYFVTICTDEMVPYFGDVVRDRVARARLRPSAIGTIAHQCWSAIPHHFPFVILDEFIVMPNHVHGILHINHPAANVVVGVGVPADSVETQDLASPPPHDPRSPLLFPPSPSPSSPSSSEYKNTFGPQSRNLASIISGFKIGVTKYARKNNIAFRWQPGFYDVILWNEIALYKIEQYIIDNPRKWLFDGKDRNQRCSGLYY